MLDLSYMGLQEILFCRRPQTMVSSIPLFRALEPECRILMFTWSYWRPFESSLSATLFLTMHLFLPSTTMSQLRRGLVVRPKAAAIPPGGNLGQDLSDDKDQGPSEEFE